MQFVRGYAHVTMQVKIYTVNWIIGFKSSEEFRPSLDLLSIHRLG